MADVSTSFLSLSLSLVLQEKLKAIDNICEEDLVQACASVAAYQTKLSRFENGSVSSSSKSSGGMWNMFSNEKSVETPKKKEEEEEEEEDLIDFGDSPVVEKKKVEEEEEDLQGDVVVRSVFSLYHTFRISTLEHSTGTQDCRGKKGDIYSEQFE